MTLVGKQVKWTKLKGKENASMHETSGFGVLLLLEGGRRMMIAGDYGLSSSVVKWFESTGDEVYVTTQSSVYLVKLARKE